ncbi:diguanylate cyclase domain-containing protein [Methylomonas sp. MgM2]
MELNLTAENNAALNELLRIAAMPISLEQMLGKSLDALLSLSWLSVLPKAGIFLVSTDESGRPSLRLVIERRLDAAISTLCSEIQFGQCLCGRAALSRTPLHVSCVDDLHEIRYEGIQPHGHYIIPIMSDETCVGVLLFYLQEGARQKKHEINFLIRCSAVLALAIELRRKERELETAIRELSFQKKTLDQHAIVSIADVEGRITYVNDKFCEISGFNRNELIGQNHRMLKSGEHSKDFYRNLWRTISSGKVWHGEIKNKRKDDGFYWVSATIVPFMNERGKPFQYVAIRTDISERKAAEFALEQAQSIAKIGSWTLDIVNNKLTWSDQIFLIFGIDPEQFGASFDAFLETIHPDDRKTVLEHYLASIDGHVQYDIEHRIVRRNDGEIRWVHERCMHQRNKSGEVFRSDGTVQDITERKQAQEEIQRLAMTDHLTGIANRNQFHRRFSESLHLAKRENFVLALLLLDLDRFKPINDAYGHIVGDEALKVVASAFSRERRQTDVVARLGGDEFAILLVNPDSPSSIERCAQKIIAEVSEPFYVRDHRISLGVSIGIATFPTDGSTEDDLIHQADVALYEVKRLGRNSYCFYRPELGESQ